MTDSGNKVVNPDTGRFVVGHMQKVDDRTMIVRIPFRVVTKASVELQDMQVIADIFGSNMVGTTATATMH